MTNTVLSTELHRILTVYSKAIYECQVIKSEGMNGSQYVSDRYLGSRFL